MAPREEGDGQQRYRGLLPIHPQPLPDEWVGSWLHRVAQGNALPLLRLLPLLGVDPSKERLSPAEMRRVRNATGLSSEALTKLRPPPDLLPRSSVVTPFLGISALQVCPGCLRSDPEPYFRREWLRLRTIACPRHGGPLRDTCPHCRSALRLVASPTLRKKLTDASASHHRPTTDLRRCPVCTGDIATDDGQPLTVFPTVTTPTSIITAPVKPKEWDALYDSVWQVILTFRLEAVLEPGRLLLGPLGILPTSHTPHSRMAAHALHTWLLGTQGETFFHIHNRLRVAAAPLISLLEVKADLDTERRWMYVVWLMTRLALDTSEQVLRDWPKLARTLCDRFVSPPALPEPVPFHLTDAQWAALAPVIPVPERFSHVDPRETLTGILNEKLGQRAGTGAGQHVQERLIKHWIQGGHLGRALSRLYSFRPLPETSEAGEQQTEFPALRLFGVDAVVELCRQANPDLHRHLVFDLSKPRR